MIKRGFTLIELLIVIAVIGILAGIVVGVVGVSANQKAQDTKLKKNLVVVQTQLEQYFIDTGAYPTAAEFSQATPANNVLYTSTPKYLNSTSTLANLTYTVTASGGYELSFVLNDQNQGTSDTVKTNSDGKKIYYVTSKQQ